MGLGCLPDTHLMLLILSLNGLMHEVLVGQDFTMVELLIVLDLALGLCLLDTRRHLGKFARDTG
jgi:hypothetical protein